MPKKTIMTLLAILSLHLPALAETNLGLELGYLYGDTTYQIGGEEYGTDGVALDHFPISELKFPLNSYVAVLSLETRLDPLNFKVELTKDVYQLEADMEDSDWLAPGRLDIYSESEAERKLFTAETKAAARVWGSRALGLNLGLGYAYQQFNYTCEDTVQYSPSGLYSGYTGVAPGKTINYDIEYHIPYAEVAMTAALDNCDLNLSLGMAPYVKVYDHDEHVRRPKFMDGVLDGHAYLANFSGHYRLAPQLDLNFGIDYKKIETEGEQEQFGLDSGSPFYVNIEEEVTSEQLRSTIGLSLRF
ncbi:MAG: Outer membrane protease OmpP precursor [Deltaproteobacteria bacterium ADurb.Bin510]|nr:MAG: Outer membrane protease OmpP precursor [Deltaproteobacteria bacterium ADurb.Bin510]